MEKYGTRKENTLREKSNLFKDKLEKDILLRNLFFNAMHVLLDDVVLSSKLDCSGLSNDRFLV